MALPEKSDYSIVTQKDACTATMYYQNLAQALRYWKKIKGKGKFFHNDELIDPGA